MFAFAGICTSKSGIMTMSYWVLIIDHSWFREPDKKMFAMKLEVIAIFDPSVAAFKAS